MSQAIHQNSSLNIQDFLMRGTAYVGVGAVATQLLPNLSWQSGAFISLVDSAFVTTG